MVEYADCILSPPLFIVRLKQTHNTSELIAMSDHKYEIFRY